MRGLLRFLGRGDVLRDLHLYGGLALATVGAWQLSPAAALIVLGLVLALLGLLAGRLVPRSGPDDRQRARR